MTFVLFGLLSSGRFLVRKDLTKNVNLGLRALRPLPADFPRARKLLREFSLPGTSSASSSRPLGGQGKPGGLRVHLVLLSGGAPSPPARPRSSERGGSASGHLSGVGRARFLLSLRLRAVEVWKLPALDRLPFPASPSLWTPPHSHRTFHDVRM